MWGLFRHLSEILGTQKLLVRLVTLVFLEVGDICEECVGLGLKIESDQLAVSRKELWRGMTDVDKEYSAPYFMDTQLRPRGMLLVAQLVEALRYKPEGRGFDSRWCHWNFSLT